MAWLNLSKIFYARLKWKKEIFSIDAQRMHFVGILWFGSENCSLHEKWHSPNFIALILIYASNDHDSKCVRLPWSWRTSFTPHMAWSDLSKIFYARLKWRKAMAKGDTQRVSLAGFLWFGSEKCSLHEKLHAPAFIAFFLIYASYDHDSMCVRLLWSCKTSLIP